MSETEPLYVDIAALLDGGLPDPPEPVLLHRDDGRCLFYDGQVNYLFGDPETGKTWVAAAASVEALRSNRRALIVDLDHNGAAATVTRLLELGAPLAALRDAGQFRYAEPEDIAHLDGIIADMRSWRPAVATVDSIGELLPLLRLSSNSPDDFTVAHGRVLKPLARAGAAVIAVDHLAKNSDSRQHGASGTAAKRRAIGGTSLRVTIKEPFSPGRGGACWLNIHKDRHGGLRAHCPTDTREPLAGIFTMRQEGDVVTWHVASPRDGERPAELGAVSAEDIAELDALDPPPESVRDVKARLSWRSDRAANALREWRSRCSPGTVGEQGTPETGGVPRSHTPMSGNGEHAADPWSLNPLRPHSGRSGQHSDPGPNGTNGGTNGAAVIPLLGCLKHPSTAQTSDGRCPLCVLDKIQGGA